jgi:hypothetical protein
MRIAAPEASGARTLYLRPVIFTVSAFFTVAVNIGGPVNMVGNEAPISAQS